MCACDSEVLQTMASAVLIYFPPEPSCQVRRGPRESCSVDTHGEQSGREPGVAGAADAESADTYKTLAT